MKHEDYKEWIQLAALGELDDEKRRVLGAHLEVCTDCRMGYDELVKVMSIVGEARPAKPTETELELARGRLSPRRGGS